MSKKHEEIVETVLSNEMELPVEEDIPLETPTKKSPKRKAVNGEQVKESQRKLYTVDARLIVNSLNDNHRNPFTKTMHSRGIGLFEAIPGHEEGLALWYLAVSDDPALRAEFLRLMELYEQSNPADPTIIDLATSIHAGLKGQMHQVFLRDNGVNKKTGNRTFTLIAGHRRVLAILWLWCKGLRKTPSVEVEFVKGNNLDLTALQKDENALRKNVSPVIVAQGYRRSLSEGATLEQVAAANGVSEATVDKWLKFLELEPKEQIRLEEGKLRHEDAVQIVDDRRKGGEGKTKDGKTVEEAVKDRPKGTHTPKPPGKMTTAKMVALYKNPPSDWCVDSFIIQKVLGIILGKMDKTGNALSSGDEDPAPGGDFEAILPPDNVGIGLLDDEELIVDDNGDIIQVNSSDE
jgi:ParB-like chromosome segregation protein Spo0J